jgi:hypothetical protein
MCVCSTITAKTALGGAGRGILNGQKGAGRGGTEAVGRDCLLAPACPTPTATRKWNACHADSWR